jgi:hypothetical protein
MFRYGPALLILWTILVSASPVQAQRSGDFWSNMRRDYKRNQAWPEPFLRPDRDAVNLPFALMVANGWRRQNLLSDYHFDETTSQLNLAGEMKLRFILTQMPPNRRTVFVQRGLTPDVTSSRIELVQRVAVTMMAGGGMPDVVESDLPNDGWPADDIDAVNRKFRATRPDPRLKDASSGGGSSGGSGGGSAGGP